MGFADELQVLGMVFVCPSRPRRRCVERGLELLADRMVTSGFVRQFALQHFGVPWETRYGENKRSRLPTPDQAFNSNKSNPNLGVRKRPKQNQSAGHPDFLLFKGSLNPLRSPLPGNWHRTHRPRRRNIARSTVARRHTRHLNIRARA